MALLQLNSDYYAHTQSTSNKLENSNMYSGGGIPKVGIVRSCAKWSLSSLPANAIVSQVRFRFTITAAGGATATWNIGAYNSVGQTNPDPDADATCYARCASGVTYNNNLTTWRATGSTWITLSAAANDDVEDAKTAVGFFSLGFHEEGDDDDTATCTGSDSAILLEITYTLPGPANLKSVNGIATASVKSINTVVTASVKSVNGIT